MESRTTYDLLRASATRYPDLPALRQPLGGGRYRTYTWAEYLRSVEEIAGGLVSLGIARGDIVALDSETRAEFYLADLGIMACGAIAAAVYTTYPAAHRVRTFRSAGAKAVFVENPAMLAELRAAGGAGLALPWILLTGEAEGALSLGELMRRGRGAFSHGAGAEDAAILYMTSGATGEPKMAVVSHRALVANIDMGPQVLKLGPGDAMLAFLPSAHITQRVVVELLPLGSGTAVWFSESLLRMPQELGIAKPTIFVAPPRLWERVHTSIRAELRRRPAWLQRLVESGLAFGLERARDGRIALWKRPVLALVDRLAFAKMRARFGGRVRVCGSGSAPLGKELAEFYTAIGLPLVEGYGLTEGGVVVLNPLDAPRPGSIGKPLPGVDLRLAEDGELLVRSATLFDGYYQDPETTAQVLRDGWLHTGDLAEIDSDGYVYITGRKKELIVSSTGRKIYPSRIEALFHLEPVVSHVLPIGDRLPHVVALITVNETVAPEGREARLAEVERAVARVNRKLAPFEQIRRYRVLDRDFAIESGELTATLKVRRARVLENFRDEVAEIVG